MLDEAVDHLAAAAYPSELLVVDDGSTDTTAELVTSYAMRRSSSHVAVRLLRQVPNAGKGAAVRAGAAAASGSWILMADADGATRFADVESLFAAVTATGADAAVGSRAHLRGRRVTTAKAGATGGGGADGGGSTDAGGGRDALRSFLSRCFHMVVVLLGGVRGIADTQCGFKLYSAAAAVVAFRGQQLTRWAFDVENLYRLQAAGMRVVEVPVTWTEISGSKMGSLARVGVRMLSDVVRMRWSYATGQWTLPSRGGRAALEMLEPPHRGGIVAAGHTQ
ncbi:hypothetical protein MMPV_001810 [Pyropia vietnamensis]